MFKRALDKPLEDQKSFFLFGPRETGKTTWLKERIPQTLFINLLQSQFYNRLAGNPGHIRTLIPPITQGGSSLTRFNGSPTC